MFDYLLHGHIVEGLGRIKVGIKRSNFDLEMKFFHYHTDIFIHLYTICVTTSRLMVGKGFAETTANIQNLHIWWDPSACSRVISIEP